MRILHLLFCLGPIFATHAAAATFVLETGKPVEVDFGGGRRVELRVARRQPIAFAAKFEVAESTCAGGSRSAGAGRAAFAAKDVRFELYWTQHPSSEKIGQPALLKLPDFKELRFRLSAIPSTVTEGNRKKMPVATADLPRDWWESADFSWLPPGTASAPAGAYFVRWDVEFMQFNAETGLMENRSLNLASGMTFERNSERRLDVADVRSYGTSLSAFLVGDVWSIVLREADGFCQLSLKPNLSQLQQEANTYFNAPLPPFGSYLYGEDEFSNKNDGAYFFTTLMTLPGGFDVE